MTDDPGGAAAHRTRDAPAEILAPAPILAVGALVIGFLPQLVVPVGGFPTPWNYLGGSLLVVLGVGLVLSGVLTMRRIDKSPSHEDEPTTLLTEGPFRYTRNPLYLGITLVYLGVTGLLNSLWPLVPLVALVWYFNRMAKREEAYLRGEFGDEFRNYADDVRRWV